MVPVVPAPGAYFAPHQLKIDEPIPYVFGNTSEDTEKNQTQQYTQIKKSFFQIVMREWPSQQYIQIKKSFFQIVMREWPSQQYAQIKKSFFQRGETRFDLGDVFFYRQHATPPMFHENNDCHFLWDLVLLKAGESI
ncbi:uncharacterized protein J4E78_003746 [Alternaria triticimaculans]|uniref:uncharacterized protein n=1 Tax=Alternaria triticimaculans TaxID=297637 RepID=UPI0020C567F7|nr:uncharacterized protein J4E78_003746 [Alternaria triticimaculans]KAI4663334.1 hypothetical protein J4E78_003746 [Alternaria triticimaculans]